jgi:V/A-type H+-transporting ATPase subunit E
MALADLLRAIESDASAERARTYGEAAVEAAAVVERAREEALTIERELASAPEERARATADRERALARVDAARAVRAAREEAFDSVLAGVRTRLATSRGTDAYPALFRALLAECRTVLPTGDELRIDPRDVELALPLAEGLMVEAALETWGGVELRSSDGRTVRNTLEERLINAELLLRLRFAKRLAASEHEHSG